MSIKLNVSARALPSIIVDFTSVFNLVRMSIARHGRMFGIV